MEQFTAEMDKAMTNEIRKGEIYVCDTDELSCFTYGNRYMSTKDNELIADNDISVYITESQRANFTIQRKGSYGGDAMVEHPKHYNCNGIECFDVIRAFYGDDALENFCLCNALKYIMRCKLKDNYRQDLKKADFYIRTILGE